MKGSLSNVINLLTLIHPGERKSINLLTLKFVNLSTLARETYQNLTNYCSFKTNPPWREKFIQIYQFIDASIFQLIHPVEWKLSKPYEGKLISLLTLWCCERKLIKTLWSEADPFIGLSTLPFIDFNIYFSTFPTCPPWEERVINTSPFCQINSL